MPLRLTFDEPRKRGRQAQRDADYATRQQPTRGDVLRSNKWTVVVAGFLYPMGALLSVRLFHDTRFLSAG